MNNLFRAIDMERTRRAEMKRQYEIIAKAALVNNIKVNIFIKMTV